MSTVMYGLIGKTLTHSFSQKYFTEKFEREGIDALYGLFELPEIESIELVIQAAPNLRGLNVTIPYKAEIFAYLDAVDAVADALTSVNTVDIRNGKWTGYNTDVTGFRDSLKNWLPRPGLTAKALILGTGASSRTVRYVLREQFSLQHIFRVSRRPGPGTDFTYESLKENDLGQFDLIVNTTPLGTFPAVDECPDLNYGQLGPRNFLYDLVYNPAETAFLNRGKSQGAKTKNGQEMLALQAEAAWEIWSR